MIGFGQVYIPDANFKAYLVGNTAINTNGDSEIQASEAVAFNGTIYCGSNNVSDLTGIEAFTALTALYCYGNQLTSIDVSNNTALYFLNCGNNQLTSLDVSSNTNLHQLHCYMNDLTSLNVNNNTTLTLLYCYSNELTSLDVSNNTALTSLKTMGNLLSTLDVSNNIDLSTFLCAYNQLTSLAVSNNTNLGVFSCSDNQLTSLDVSQNTSLTYLDCSNNQLTSLDVRNGNNTNITQFSFKAFNNPNLLCIDVDNVAWSTANWISIEPWTGFSSNCATAVGCIDPAACNYIGATIIIDDGSCLYANTGTTSVTSCDSYTWEGQTITVSGDLVHVYQNAAGCDSTHTLSVTITNSSLGTSSATSCDSYTWEGQTITVSGDLVHVYQNAAGCDSTHTLSVTINNSISNSTSASMSATSCDIYLWSINGMAYGTSGTYIDTSVNTAGCMHIDTLVLTINNSTNASTSQIACNSYTWNGVTYNSSGIYTYTTTNSNGCDSIVTLALIVDSSTVDTVYVDACDSYFWNGSTYTLSGIYTYTSISTSGCTHIENLVLTINNSTNFSMSVIACDTYSWNGVNYTTSGTYTNTYINTAGCESVNTLNLIIDYATIVYDTISICNGASYGVINSVYTNAGDYIDSTLNSNGCVSVIYTHLTIELALNSSITQVGSLLESTVSGGVGSYTYLWNNLATTPDITISSTGSYWLIIMDSLLCPIDTAYYEVINLPTDMSEIGINNLSIYPNPSKDVFNINFTSAQEQNLKVRVLNIIGEEFIIENLQEFIGKYTKQIDLNNNSKGIYFLEITTNNGVINKKLIFQ
jgi:Leucine-rich repeat (LRR) protein